MHDRYVAGLVDVVVGLVGDGHRVRLVTGDDVDAPVAQRVRGESLHRRPEAAAAIEVAHTTGFDELSEQMSAGEVVVASRYHNLICALRIGRPVVSLELPEERVADERFGLQAHERPIEDLDPEALLSKLAELRRDGALLGEHIRDRAREMREEALLLLEGATRAAFSSTAGSRLRFDRAIGSTVGSWKGPEITWLRRGHCRAHGSLFTRRGARRGRSTG